jgi:hypothetical protein
VTALDIVSSVRRNGADFRIDDTGRLILRHGSRVPAKIIDAIRANAVAIRSAIVADVEREASATEQLPLFLTALA